MIIKSPKNPIFKKLMDLTKSKGVKEEGLALVSGEKITKEIAKINSHNSFWVMTEDMGFLFGGSDKTKSSGIDFSKGTPIYKGFDETRSKPEKNNPVTSLLGTDGEIVCLSKELFYCLDVFGTKKPLLCCQYEKPKSFLDLESDLAALYVAVSDPGNLGALIRSCAAFFWPQVVLLSESAHPFLPKAIRSSSGTVFKTSFFEGPSIGDLSDPGIVALDKNGKVFDRENLKRDLKLLVGEEGQGIPENFRGERLSIPISREVESLNVTVAASLVIHEWSSKMHKRCFLRN